MRFKLGRFAGIVKTWTQRLQTYVSIVNFFLLFYLFIGDNEWFAWYQWFTIIVVSCVVLLFVDIRYIMPNALGYQWEKNNSFKRLESKIDRLLEDKD